MAIAIVSMALRRYIPPLPRGRRTLARSSRSVAQPGSASHWGCGGRWFESTRSDQKKPWKLRFLGLFFCFSRGSVAASRRHMVEILVPLVVDIGNNRYGRD